MAGYPVIGGAKVDVLTTAQKNVLEQLENNPRVITTISAAGEVDGSVIRQNETVLIGTLTSPLLMTIAEGVNHFSITDQAGNINPVNTVKVTLRAGDSLTLSYANDNVEFTLDSSGDWSYYNLRDNTGVII